jgi:hypothetical protein
MRYVRKNLEKFYIGQEPDALKIRIRIKVWTAILIIMNRILIYFTL